MTTRRERRAMDAMYAKLPTLNCQGKCAESCGPIAMSRIEHQRIVERTGAEPQLKEGGLDCSLLEDERCTVYDIRPTICRLWGIVESMPCPWGCRPSRALTREEGYVFLREAQRISDA